jgi:response regulator RpfG family c-di-GMP phosphodiesterase
MGAIGETRSKETGLHVKRVAEYSYLLGKFWGLSEEDASLLKQASPMHDIGKVGIADDILNKPAKLTFEEFEIMKTHAEIGYEMLKHSKRPILKASSMVAISHHEKWDGSGYPKGLKGERIPIFGRITAIADVFDALGHDRCYKKAWPLENILELFRNEKGKHFDPSLVDLFFENLDEFLEIRDSMQDHF